VNNPYILLPLRFSRFPNSKVLIVNDSGEYLFLNPVNFENLISYRLDHKSELFLNLKGKHIVTDTDITPIIDLLATKYITKKAFLQNFTYLHMVVLTLRCNHRCNYCHASSEAADKHSWDMSQDTAKKVVQMVMETPSSAVKIEFQGGEPLLNFDIIKLIVKEAKKLNRQKNKNLSFVLCTNLTLIDKPILRYLKKEGILVSTSLDGPKEIHDCHRIMRNGESSYDSFIEKLRLSKDILDRNNISPLMTITQNSISHLKEIIDEYVDHGFQGIFLRNLNPYGYARTEANKKVLEYSTNEFIEAYKKILPYIIQINLSGTHFPESFTTILLTRILTPFSTGFVDLQSPTGAGISGVIYNYNGDVYPSDEARMLAKMGDQRFLMGNVNKDSYFTIFESKILREIIESSCVETIPGCHSCAYQIYCGADPIRNYATQKDLIGHRPTNDFCHKNKKIITFLLELIEKDDPDTMDVFWSWITNRSLTEVRGQIS